MNDSGFGRLLGALFSPGKTFRSIAERPTWVWPLLLLSLLAGLVFYLGMDRVDLPSYIQQQSEAQGRLSAEQLEQQREALEKADRFLPAVFGGGMLLLSPPFFLVVALLFWMAFRLMGSELSYRQSFSTTLHGFLPLFGVASLLSLPVFWSRQEMTMAELQGGVLASNLGILAGEETGPVALALLTSVDFFSIWTLILLVLGFKTVARSKTGTATTVVLLVWSLGIGWKLFNAAMQARMGG